MLFGFVGAHRSGKTTLARRISEDTGIHFHETSTTKVCRELGYDPVAPMTLYDRAMMQAQLLDHHIETLKELPRPVIVDRTPIDMMAYTLAEFHMTSHMLADPAVLEGVNKLAETCLKATVNYFDFLYYFDPLPEYVIEDGKPAANPAYQQHIALLMRGGMQRLSGKVNCVFVGTVSFDERMDYVCEHMCKRIDEISVMANAAPFH